MSWLTDRVEAAMRHCYRCGEEVPFVDADTIEGWDHIYCEQCTEIIFGGNDA